MCDDQHSQENQYAIVLDWYFNGADNKTLAMHVKRQSVRSLDGFRQGLSANQQYFSLTTNQHQPSLSV